MEVKREKRPERKCREKWDLGEGGGGVNACEETMQARSFYLNWRDWHSVYF